MHDVNAWSPRTRSITAGRPAGEGEPLNAGIAGISTYQLGGPREYARAHGTPTWDACEEVLGSLEGGTATMFSSGMGAVAAVFSLVPAGGRIAAPLDCYLGSASLLRRSVREGRWQVTWLDPRDTGAWVAAAGDHDLLWLESPTNPLLRIMDLPTILGAAGPGCLTAVDNTFPTPYGQQPLGLGADLVVHSATKYLGGHSDLMAGAVISREAGLAEQVVMNRTLYGATLGMLEAFLVTRGMRTLFLRMEAACRNAGVLAERLQDHPAVSRVRYPGLPDDPGHALASSFMGAFGAMLSFELAGGQDAADAVCAHVRLIRHATSLGGVESTLERRGALPGQEHVPGSLIRLSTGCEDGDDLWADLGSALDAAAAS